MMELHLQSPIYLHGTVLNYLSTKTTLHLYESADLKMSFRARKEDFKETLVFKLADMYT
jgi:hypothetical protein